MIEWQLQSPSRTMFLCHSTQDKKFARQLVQDLDFLSIDVWYDDWELAVGDSLHDCIHKAVEQAAYVGVLVSANSLESRWCRAELHQALSREKTEGRKVVLPLVYQDIEPPSYLVDRLYIRFSCERYLQGLTEFAAAVLGITRRSIARALEDAELESLAGVQDALEQARTEELHEGLRGGPATRASSLRGSVPSRVRNGVLKLPLYFGALWGLEVFVTSLRGESARIYPLATFADLEDRIRRAAKTVPGLAKLRNALLYYGSTGRVSIRGDLELPSLLRESAKLQSKVMLLGRQSFIEVFDSLTVNSIVKNQRGSDIYEIAAQVGL